MLSREQPSPPDSQDVTAEGIGLGNVDNTADVNKPTSAPTLARIQAIDSTSYSVSLPGAVEESESLLQNPRWLNPLPTPNAPPDEGFYGSGQVVTTVEPATQFGYEGNAVRCETPLSNFLYLLPTERIEADQAYQETGRVSVNLELYADETDSVQIRLFRADADGSEVQLSSDNLDIVGGEVTVFNRTVDFPADQQDLRIRLFNPDGPIWWGRLGIFGGDLAKVESEADTLGIVIAKEVGRAIRFDGDEAEAGSEGGSEDGEVTLTGNPRWVNDAQFDNTSEGTGFFPVSQVSFEMIDAAAFGYEGRAVRASSTGSNWIMGVDASDILPLPNGQLSVTYEALSDTAQTVSCRMFGKSDTSEPTLNSQSVTFVPGEVQTIQAVIPFADDFTQLRIRFFNATGPLTIGRVGLRRGSAPLLESQADINLASRIQEIRTYSAPSTSKNPVIQWGDSLTAQSEADDALGQVSGRAVSYQGFGGERSYQILDRYLAAGPSDRTHIFWVGRNNFGQPNFDDIVVSDVAVMVANMTHRRFIVCMPPNGEFATEYRGTGERYPAMLRLEQRLRQIYGPRFLDVRSLLIQSFKYEIAKLAQPFAQPAIGESVQITFDVNALVDVGDAVRIGQLNLADEYQVTAVNGNTITATLTEAVSVDVGETVDNETFDGPNGAQESTFFRHLMRGSDYDSYHRDIPPDTLRSDGVHFEPEANLIIATAQSDLLDQLGY